MPDVEALAEAVDEILTETSDLVDIVSEIDMQSDDGLLAIVLRGVIRRQYDSLEAIQDLAKRKRGYAATPLLRPACEELIYLRYFKLISPEQAETIVFCMAVMEQAMDLSAQRNYAGEDAILQIGFSREQIDRAGMQATHARATLKKIGGTLGWSRRALQRRIPVPSVWELARQTDSETLYRFLYHATSRPVHFTVSELLRRVWGDPPAMTIRSSHMDTYWSAFALFWGLHLFIETLIEVWPLLEPVLDDVEVDEERFLEAAGRVGRFGMVPIITPEELAWPPTVQLDANSADTSNRG
jgi:hypothetical protein